ncbi:peptidoglycan bridge formation glycyltransferase FemA/FemB family protein [Rufibacter glacialis]|uniref:Peptidoglycan bridge formation glycyltransferase FemA/FemB family protein n=1 Tax=Rufibacter glacialis TaxID=1259555 RepID=A0A5M8QLN0_9BACT|nr:peptidoglycan bridge formation glycyltransferase FemA/FemB family protein [Rufibacter glacialis]KAA6435676.1 peptidoglycan bridge formation glycyltransferase FemA/FemB family protein [Rufibacter glacialis]GGK65498.1 hypothetical protein GCM10011405_11880 [Rufibacter glacialis]
MQLGDKYEGKCLATAEEMAALPPFSFEVFLYLQPRHVALQVGPCWRLFVLLNTHTGHIDALAHFFTEEKTAYSPWRAPFGGLQVAPDVPAQTALAFLQYFHQNLQETGITEIRWLQCPDAYALGSNQFLRAALPNLGYRLLYDQRNHHVPVTNTAFAVQAHPSLKRRLAKSEKAGFFFQQESGASLPEAYAFLKECRQEKQKPLSLSLPQLTRYFEKFPEHYLLFTVRQKQELAAVGVAVLISSKIMNHLYPASPRRFNAYSPSVLLNAGLYAYCQEHHIPVLDLGVSAPPDETEEDYQGLFTFKSRLGGVESWKPTFLWREGE